ncbi:MAG: hypothetical protein ACRDHL_10525, partial [Candidatus Promineifilaceae bacterium]
PRPAPARPPTDAPTQAAVTPTLRPTSLPTATATPQPTASPTPAPPVTPDLYVQAADIAFFPVPALYAGDLVTIRVAPDLPAGLAPNDVDIQLQVDGRDLAAGTLGQRNLAGEPVGLFEWVWDTRGQAGQHIVSVLLDPDNAVQVGDENPHNNRADVPVNVLLPAGLSDLEANAEWVTAATTCCRLHVVSGTAAQRDLYRLTEGVQIAFERAAERLGEELAGPYEVYLIDRVIGQGGYSGQTMVVSYLDRDYAGGGLDEVLTHEAVHLLDRSFAPERITFLSEGVAVWAAGGHYRQEEAGRRMAALVELGQALPLTQVIDNFYASQHEIGYLQAASLIEYLVAGHGWPRVRSFYADASPRDGASPAAAVSATLERHFGRSLAEVERDWLTYLGGLPRNPRTLDDLRLTLRLYETMRRYQSMYDPGAYYLSAWLPDPAAAEARGATADFSRHPEAESNLALETMLQSANGLWLAGEYGRAHAILDSVERVLNHNGAFLDPLAKAHLDIVRAAAQVGYEVQTLTIAGDRATVVATWPSLPTLQHLTFGLVEGGAWVLLS